jgi:hypothetical protein
MPQRDFCLTQNFITMDVVLDHGVGRFANIIATREELALRSNGQEKCHLRREIFEKGLFYKLLGLIGTLSRSQNVKYSPY